MVGDGAMQMGGMAEMLTAAKYYREWADPRLVILVLNNEDLNQVTWEQRAMAGDPRFEASQAIPYVPFDQWARMIGLNGIKVDRADQIDAAWEQAFAADRPVIIDAITTPDEPPIPPHVTFEQAEALMKSLAKDPSGRMDRHPRRRPGDAARDRARPDRHEAATRNRTGSGIGSTASCATSNTGASSGPSPA